MLILVDGYTAAGKSTSLGIFKNILNDDFDYLIKYSTRLPRLNEKESEIFTETKFLKINEFNIRKFEIVYQKSNIFYGISKSEIDSKMNNKYLFIIANPFFRNNILLYYKDKVKIIQIFIQTSSLNRYDRIRKAKMGSLQTEQRLIRFYSNKERNMQEFDFIINNDSTIKEFHNRLISLIKIIKK
jgi:dephospho-CoA kinase